MSGLSRRRPRLDITILLLVVCVVASNCGGVAIPTQQNPSGTSLPGARAHAEVSKVRPADDAMMVYVPAGEFVMGSNKADVIQALESSEGWTEDWFDGELPQHTVQLAAYWIDKYEVTNRQFAQFIEAGGYEQRSLWTQEGWDWKTREQRRQPKYWDSPPWNAPDLPVVGIVWFEAVAYCRWAGARLPTDAEWERAAGWDADKQEKRVYPWGNEWDPNKANTKESSGQGTTVPGEYCPQGESPVGACDMAGNVWEWCSSLYMPLPYAPYDGREDLEAKGTRVLRSGSWLNAHIEARTTYRLPPFPGDFILFDPTNGFRCAMSDQRKGN